MDTEEMTHWENVVALERAASGEGQLVEEYTGQAVVLISNGKMEYSGIGLVEVLWKVVAEFLNRHLTSSITYHDFLHGSQEYCDTGNGTLEGKPLQQLAAMREDVLYVIFLDLHKAYDALDMDRCLEILEGYCVGPLSFRIIRTYWYWLRVVARLGGYYRTEFQGFRGVAQGGPLSPTIFNVVVDAVVRHWFEDMIDIAGRKGGIR